MPAHHQARDVLAVLEQFDLREVEAQYSALGRHGYHPRHMLGVLILGSLMGLHESTKLAAALKTDAALRLVAGGHAISAGRLRAFRRVHAALFADCIEQTVRLACERGLLREQELAVDSMRLRADAARAQVRTLEHAQKRLRELEATDPATLSPVEQQVRLDKLARHRDTVQQCLQSGRTNLVSTTPSAALIKFPTGASAPGHRITVVAAGVSQRLVVAVLVDADANDYGKLAPALQQACAVMRRAGLPPDRLLQAAADAGYNSEGDLRFASRNRDWLDLLVPMETAPHADSMTKGYFDRERFELQPNGQRCCPAGTLMRGPIRNGDGRLQFRGVGCVDCPLKAQCTPHQRRVLTVAPGVERERRLMGERMVLPDAHARYQQRMATVEPVFSSLQDTMGYRRASTRQTEAVVAEILLKVLAYNICRLAAAKKAALFVFVLEP